MGREISQIQHIAGNWVARRDSGNWSEADEACFQQWLNASTLHRVEFLRLETAWNQTRRVKALAAGVPSDRPPAPGQWNLSPFFEKSLAPPQINRRRAWALAASLLLVIVTGVLTWQFRPVGQQYTTAVGGTASVPMSDGSHVTLNTDSEIRVALSPSERHVDLEHGEAFFEVAKDPNRPFVVEAGRKRVVAVGTQFSVRREGDAIQVVVTEGKVRVEDNDPNAPVFLTPGAVARVGDAGVLVQRKTLPEAEEALSWRSGTLTFRDATLADAIAEFNRYSERKVVIDDPAVAALKIEGNFRANNLAAFLELLQGGYPVKVVEEPDRYVLTGK
jgi:transmembrane sensor